MMRLPKKSRLWTGFAGAVVMGMIAGCSGAGEKTTEAMQLMQELDYRAALTELQTAEEAGENARLIARGQGIAYMGLADYEHAISCFEEALRSSDGFVQPVDYDINYYLAAAYAKNGQLAEAENIYSAILDLKTDEEAFFLRGTVRLEQNDYENAKADFDRVIAMDGTDYDRIIQIYQSLDTYGYKEVGRQYLNQCLEANGSKMNPYDMGRMYYYLGEYEQAYMILEKAKAKGDANTYLYLGKAYEATGDYNYASSVYNSWLAKDTSNAEIYNQLGLCEMQKGNYQSALNAFQTGMKIEDNPVMQALAFNEIVAYENMEEYAQAATLMEQYLKSYPDDLQAKREYDFLKTR